MKTTLCAFALTVMAIAGSAAENKKPEEPASRAEKNQAEVQLLLRRYLAAQRAYAALKKSFAESFRAGKAKVSSPKLAEAEKKRTLKLIKELGSDKFAVREKASSELGKFGRKALPLFNAAKTRSKDPEVLTRLESLISALTPKFKSKGPVQLLGSATKTVPLPWSKVDRAFADAVDKKAVLHGYRFKRLTVSASGTKLGRKRHAMVAVPAEPGKSGKKSFIALDDLRGNYWRILAKEIKSPAIKALPAKLAETGWKRVDAVPGSSKIKALETNTVGSCRTYCSGQTMYKRNDWDRNGILEYAPRFSLLSTTPDSDGTTIQLIDKAFKDAVTPKKAKRGYFFTDMMTVDGKAIDWCVDYALCAIPAKYGKTGRRTFIVATNGTVFAKDTGGKPVFDYPADPTAKGWVIAE